MTDFLGEAEIIQADVHIILPEAQEAHNIFTYQRNDGLGGNIDPMVAFTAINDALDVFYTALAPVMSQEVEIDYVVYRIGHWEPLPAPGSWSYGGEAYRGYLNIDGESSGEMLPHQCAALITGDTEQAKTLGKKYLPGFTENDQASGRWTLGTLGILIAVGLEYLFPIVAGAYGLDPGVASKIGAFFPFIGGTISDIVSGQRRRKIGVGV